MAQLPAKKRRRLVRLYAEDAFEKDGGCQTSPDTPHGADNHASDIEANEAVLPEAFPSDTLAGLHLLKNQFPPTHQVGAPLLLRSQLYSLVHNHTDVDQELERLRLSQSVRVFKLPGTTDDYAFTLKQDYLTLLDTLAQPRATWQPITSDHTPACDSKTELSEVVRWFKDGVIPKCREVQVSQPDLLKLLASQSRRHNAEPTHEHVQLLLSSGLLMRHSSGSFLFGIPGAGAIIKAVTGVRKELAGMLKRRRYSEIPWRELQQKKLQASCLGMQFHVRDMVGRGLIKVLDTPAGKLVQLVKHGR